MTKIAKWSLERLIRLQTEDNDDNSNDDVDQSFVAFELPILSRLVWSLATAHAAAHPSGGGDVFLVGTIRALYAAAVDAADTQLSLRGVPYQLRQCLSQPTLSQPNNGPRADCNRVRNAPMGDRQALAAGRFFGSLAHSHV